MSAGRSPGLREGPGGDRPRERPLSRSSPATPRRAAPALPVPPRPVDSPLPLPRGPAPGPRLVGESVWCDSSCCLENTFLLCYCFGFNRENLGHDTKGLTGGGGWESGRGLWGAEAEWGQLQVKGQGRRSGVGRERDRCEPGQEVQGPHSGLLLLSRKAAGSPEEEETRMGEKL